MYLSRTLIESIVIKNKMKLTRNEKNFSEANLALTDPQSWDTKRTYGNVTLLSDKIQSMLGKFIPDISTFLTVKWSVL